MIILSCFWFRVYHISRSQWFSDQLHRRPSSSLDWNTMMFVRTFFPTLIQTWQTKLS